MTIPTTVGLTPRQFAGTTAVLLLLATLPASARTQHDEHASAEQHHDEHAESHHARGHLAVFSGSTVLDGHAAFTLGGDFEYRLPVLHDAFGLGALVDATFGGHPTTIVGGGLFIHPAGGLKLLAAPGVEFSEGHRDPLFRAGVAYDVHIGHWSLSPTANFDFINGHLAQVFGVAIGVSLF